MSVVRDVYVEYYRFFNLGLKYFPIQFHHAMKPCKWLRALTFKVECFQQWCCICFNKMPQEIICMQPLLCFNSKVKKLEEATNYMWPCLSFPVHLWDVKAPIVFVSIR